MNDTPPLRLEAERTERGYLLRATQRVPVAPWFTFDLWKEYLLEQGRRIVDVEVREYL